MSDKAQIAFNKNVSGIRIPFLVMLIKVLKMSSKIHLRGDFFIFYATDRFYVLFPKSCKKDCKNKCLIISFVYAKSIMSGNSAMGGIR